ncbi:hypothetical protein HanIR_Chr12g0572851 [Helianthus annuus]|nr:hypothetical protein HanIR_Chr12g0572851 [Helianthus annuus]
MDQLTCICHCSIHWSSLHEALFSFNIKPFSRGVNRLGLNCSTPTQPIFLGLWVVTK